MTGPDSIVAGGIEHFIRLDGDYNETRARTRMSTNMGSRIDIHSRMQTKRDRLSKTSRFLTGFVLGVVKMKL